MRLHRLTAQAFGPFPGLVEVDFDALGSAGIFLVHGPTGAGKTSLLDAICFALYADVPGARPAGRTLRSDHAPGDATPRVTLELTSGRRRLRVERSPEFRRPKRRGPGETTVPASVALREWVAGAWEPVSTRADEAGAVLRDALGLGLDQFVKVVLLPQGDFAAFLRATPESRRAVLERLFDVSRFSDVEEWLAGQRRRAASLVAEAQAALALDQTRVDDVLARLPDGVLGDLPEWDAVALAHESAVLDGVVETVREHAATALAERDAAEADERRRVAAHDEAARHEACRAKGLAARAELAALDERAAELDAVTRQVRAGRRAASVGGDLRALDAATARAVGARTALEHAAEQLSLLGRSDLGAARDQAAAALTAAGNFDAELRDAQRLRQEIQAAQDRAERQHEVVAAGGPERAALDTEIDRLTTVLAELRRRSEALSDAPAEQLRAQGRAEALRVTLGRRTGLDDCQAALAEALARERAAADAVSEARAEWLRLRRAHLDGLAGRLAADLVDGQACPVCGSCRHPQPADSGDDVADDMVSGAEAAVAARTAGLEQARTRLAGLSERAAILRAGLAGEDRGAEDLMGDLAAAEAKSAQLETRAAELAGLPAQADRVAAQLEATRGRADVVDRRTQEAAGRLRELASAITRGGDQLAEVSRRHTEGCPCATGAAEPDDVPARHTAVVAAIERLCDAWRSLGDAQDQAASTAHSVRIRLSQCGFASEAEARAAMVPQDTLSALERTLADADRRRVGAETVLTDPDVARAVDGPRPDLVASADQAARAARVRQTAERTHAVAEQCDRDLSRVRAHLTEQIAVVADRLERQEQIARLADTAAGLGTDNTLRMRLSSYVLAARLERVVELANERLRHMGEGRFRLRHTDALAGGGRRSGLGLQVDDLWTGQTRDPATLSGGESFMASLALALGLADGVREEAGGFDVQTLFVDEGFGTLDEDSLEQVLAVLDDLRDGGRAVGVVSHVAELRTRISHQVRVAKTATGSTVTLRTEAATYSANASGGGQEQTRCRSPNAPSIRATGGQYFDVGSTPAG